MTVKELINAIIDGHISGDAKLWINKELAPNLWINAELNFKTTEDNVVILDFDDTRIKERLNKEKW